MPQLKHLARFTTPVNLNANDTKDTPIKPTSVRQTFNDVIELALTQSNQPLSITEIAELVSRQLEKAYDETTVRFAINELIAQNKITYRVETKQERAVRSDNPTLATRSMCAKLYWAPVEEVPARTVTEAVPGFRLFGNSKIHYKKYNTAYKSKRRNKAMDEVILEDISPKEAVTNSGHNAVVDYLIEKMVAERVAEITSGAVKELAEARLELARLREFIKSSL